MEPWDGAFPLQASAKLGEARLGVGVRPRRSLGAWDVWASLRFHGLRDGLPASLRFHGKGWKRGRQVYPRRWGELARPAWDV